MQRSGFTLASLALAVSTLSIPLVTALQDPPSGRRTRSDVVAPLTEAVWTNNRNRITQLLAAGEDPTRLDDQQYAAWMWAILARDNQALSLLLERVPTVPQTGHRMLLITVGQNNLAATQELLKRGVPADTPATDRSGATALLVAAASGYTQLMQALLESGATARLQDKYGDTPLMAAVRIGSLDAIRLLLARGADPNQMDEAGRTALTWAVRSRREDVRRLLRASGARGDERVARHTPLSPRAAAEKSLPLLQHSAATWVEKQRCFSCHHQPMAIRVWAVAHERGFTLDEAKARVQADRVRLPPERLSPEGVAAATQRLASPAAILRDAINNFGSNSFGAISTQGSLLEFGEPSSAGMQAAALMLARKQSADGSWRYGQPRIPFESTEFSTTAVAARVLEAYGPPANALEMRDRIERARSWLLANAAVTTDEKVYRMLGLHWTHVERPRVDEQAAALKRDQNPDGGWAQLSGMNSDAYATGLVLVSLLRAGELAVTDTAYGRGVDYLLSTQEPDGSWLVTKRAVPSNDALVDTGFPHGKFQIISYIGTSWATMALMYAAALPTAP